MAHMHSSHQTAKLNQVFEILYTQYLSSFHACNFVAQHYCNNVIPKVSNFRIKFPRLRPQKKQKWLWKGENLATDMICLKDIFQSNIFLKQIEKLSAVSTTDLTKTLRLHLQCRTPCTHIHQAHHLRSLSLHKKWSYHHWVSEWENTLFTLLL